ncbi:MAG: hypothetical protein RLZ12_373 [Bacillota bacterium]|jgi:tRNA-specific 2-thiouridylase
MKKIVVGMSGGIDSSVTAWLLKQKGYQVIGIYIKCWNDKNLTGQCSSNTDFHDMRLVCQHLQIPYYTIDLEKEYKEQVFSHFLAKTQEGYTPNPDVLCNRAIKFGAFLQLAENLGAEYIATGHYARIAEHDKQHALFKAVDKNKDQSYFLYNINRMVLDKVIFPLGCLTKIAVREIAHKIGLLNATKKDSTGICFIGEKNYRTFLKNYLPHNQGEVHTLSGEVKGFHEGVLLYTLGQRHGFSTHTAPKETSQPWYIVDKDLERNILYVAQGRDNQALFKKSLLAKDLNWLIDMPVSATITCQAKCRYRQEDQAVSLSLLTDNTAKVIFKNPQRAITPGQAIVFYQENLCLGGGTIDYTLD